MRESELIDDMAVRLNAKADDLMTPEIRLSFLRMFGHVDMEDLEDGSVQFVFHVLRPRKWNNPDDPDRKAVEGFLKGLSGKEGVSWETMKITRDTDLIRDRSNVEEDFLLGYEPVVFLGGKPIVKKWRIRKND